MPHTPRLFAFIAVVVPCAMQPLMPTAACGQEVIAMDVWPMPDLLSRRDADMLAYLATLTPDQTEAARDLIQGAHGRLQAAARKYSRREQFFRESTDYSDEKTQEAARVETMRLFEEWQKDAEGIERECMVDLRSLMSDSQTEGWASFERSRRRIVLGSASMNADLSGIAESLALTPEEKTAAAPVMERYEREIDAIAVDWRSLMRSAHMIGPEPQWQGDPTEITKRRSDLVRKLSQTQLQHMKLLAAALPGKGEQIRRAFYAAAYRRAIPAFAQSDQIKELLAVRGVSASQRDRLLELSRKADAELQGAMREPFAQAMDTWLTSDDGMEMAQAPWKQLEKERTRLQARLNKDGLGVLTEDQKRAYLDGSDPAVVDHTDVFEGWDPLGRQ